MTPNRRDVLTGIGALGVTAIASAGTAAADSHGGNGDGDDMPARIRVAHLSPDAPNVDIHVDGETVLEDVAFRSVSEYLSLPAGSYTVTVTAAGSDTVALEGHVDVAAGTDYTVAAVGELSEGTLEPLVLVDDPRALPDEVVQVRVVHAAPDAPAVDVTTDATPAPLAHDLAFGEVSTYHLALTGDATVSVGAADAEADADPVFETSLDVAGGTTYTVFAGGYLTPDDEPAHEPFGLVPAASTPRGPPAAAKVRVAHLSPDAPNVDVYLDHDRVLADVPFEAVSDYLSVSPGTYDLRVTPAGEDTAVIEDHVTVEADGAYTVAAIGELDHIAPAVFADHLEPEPGQARVRVIHASPGAGAVDVTANDTKPDIVDGLPFGEATDYLSLDPGDYELEVTTDTQADTTVGEFDVDLMPTRVYTVFAAGIVGSDDEPFRLIPVVDAAPGE